MLLLTDHFDLTKFQTEARTGETVHLQIHELDFLRAQTELLHAYENSARTGGIFMSMKDHKVAHLLNALLKLSSAFSTSYHPYYALLSCRWQIVGLYEGPELAENATEIPAGGEVRWFQIYRGLNR